MANAFGNSPYDAFNQNLDRMRMSAVAPGSGMYQGMQDQQIKKLMAAQQAAGGSAGAGSGAGGNTAMSNWNNALAMTQGRGDAVMNDPYTQAALSRLQSVLGGKDVPYTQQVQNQLLARQADAGAAAGSAQAQMLRDSQAALGGSMADPQAQAAMRAILAQGQQQNNANLGDMNSRATMANFNAKNDAANGLAAVRGAQLGMANGQYSQASQLYANQQLAGPHVNAVQDTPIPVANFNYGYQGYTGVTPAPQPNPQPPYQPPQTNPAPHPAPTGQVNRNMQVGGSGNWTGATGTGRTYNSQGVNTATGVPYGTGYVQLAGQPQTRINYGQPGAGYNPNLPVY